MLLAANLANKEWCKKAEKWLKPWQMGTHVRVLAENFPMNDRVSLFFKNLLRPCDLDKSNLSINWKGWYLEPTKTKPFGLV